MLVLLVGPKGSGKSHIGRILEARLGVHFIIHAEPLWMAFYAECEAYVGGFERFCPRMVGRDVVG